MKKLLALVLALVMAFTLFACAGKQEAPAASGAASGQAAAPAEKPAEKPAEAGTETLDLRTKTLDEIIEGAKAEGRVESVGMPDNWTHWDYSWASIKEKYGVEHADVDMSSAEEIAMFIAEKDDPTKDIGDVGISFSTVAMEEDCIQPYTLSCWDSIPDWAKDPNGYWACSYTGTTCFIINDVLTGGVVPNSWQELKDSNISVCVGNMVSGFSSQVNLLACAIAMGGGIDNVQPGIDYFKDLAKAGRIDPGDGNLTRTKAGEAQCLVGRFDFNGASWQQEVNAENIEGVHLTAVIPQDGAVMSGYCQIINKWAPHPYAAALAIEYLFSEEGQIERAYGGGRPIRTDITIPDDVPLLPDEMYGNVSTFDDLVALQGACDEISRLWQEEVLPLIG